MGLWAQSHYYALDTQFFVGRMGAERPKAAALGPGDKLYIAGETQENPQALPDGWLVCVSSAGEILWQIRPGGLGPDRIEDIVISDSILYFCGISGSALTHPEEMPVAHRADFWVGAVHAETGSLIWQHRWGSPYPDFAYTLALSPYRTLLVAGATWEDPAIGLQPILHVVSTRTGEVLQRRLLGKPGLIKRLRYAKPGLYACIGEMEQCPFVAALDDVLQILWRANLQFHPFPSRLEALYILKNGLWLIGGQYEGQWGLSAFSSEGRIVWEKTWSLPQATGCLLALAESETNEIWACGFIQTETMAHSEYRGGQDVWLSVLNGSGQILWEKALGGPRDEVGKAILLTPSYAYIIADKENRFGPLPPHNDAWIAILRAYPCDNLPVRIRHDVPSLKEKAGRTIRFWIEAPSYTKIERVVWDFGGEATAEGPSVNHIFGTPGLYEVSARLFLPYGCREVALGSIFLRITRP